MEKRLLVLCISSLVSILSLPMDSFSQSVGIGTTTPNASAALDITHTTKGLLIPRMSTPGILTIATPARGLLVYDSLINQLMVNIGTPAVPNWQPIVPGNSSNGWSLTGNSGINPANQFIGNTDNQPLRFRVNNTGVGELNPVTGNIFWGLRAGQVTTTGYSNIAIGTDALKSNTTTTNLIAIGDSALFNSNAISGGQPIRNIAIGSKSLFSNTSGSNNTSIGFESLRLNTTGFFNTAIGMQTLFSNTTGRDNTSIGRSSLSQNTTGSENIAIGSLSLFSNTTGSDNTAAGYQSLLHNTTGINNTAAGMQSLSSNTTGTSNTAAGFLSLTANTTGGDNTGIGNQALVSNITGSSNTGIGDGALFLNSSGFSNTAVGESAMSNNINGSFNVAIGQNALFSTFSSQQNTAVGFNAAVNFNMGFNNTMIGAGADVNQNDLFNCVALGNNTRCTASSQVRLGNTFTNSIGGVVGYTNLSDGRYKKNIQETVKGIDFIMKLRPVMYQLDIAGINKKLNINPGKEMNDLSKKGIDENEKTVFSGFVAQEVEQAAKAVGYDFSGVDKPKNENDMYGLRYAEFVVPMVKAMQEQQQTIDELKKQNADLQKRVLALEKK